MQKWIILFLLMAGSAFGWEAQLSCDPQIARVGQQVRLTLTIEGLRNPPQPDKVDVDGLRSSLFSNRSSSIQVINGKYSQKIQYSCILAPERTGEFTIPLTYSYKKETKHLSTSLKVLAAQNGEASDINEMFFAQLNARSDKIYVNQPFELQLEIYTIQGAQITDRINLGNMPESGLSELEWTELASAQKVVDGKIYNVRRFRSTTQALTAGTFHFAPQVTVQAVTPQQNRRNDPFFDSFLNQMQTQSIPLHVEPFTLEVLPLPSEGKPAPFSDGVGSFDFSVENIPDEIKQGDPLTVRMRIRGSGNLRSIKAPAFSSTDGIKTYENNRVSADDSEAVFEQVIMLNEPGKVTLPALTFSWFNPQKEKYETITRGPFPLEVKPNGAVAAQIVTDTPTPTRRTKILGQDILYLKPVPHQWERLDQPFWYARKIYLCLLLLPALFAVAFGLISGSVRRLQANPVEARKRSAGKNAHPALKAALKAAHANEPDTFFAESWKAISSYFADKLNLGGGEVNATRLLTALQSAGLPEDELDLFKKLLQTCEQSRYSMHTSTSTGELTQMARNLEAVIKHCERSF